MPRGRNGLREDADRRFERSEDHSGWSATEQASSKTETAPAGSVVSESTPVDSRTTLGEIQGGFLAAYRDTLDDAE